jgi:hypothetical protein
VKNEEVKLQIMKIAWRRKKIIIPTAILMVATIGTAAAILLFQHNFPGVTVPGTGTLVVNLCTQPVLTASAPGGPFGGIIFSCGVSVNSAVFETTLAATPFVSVAPFSGGIPLAYLDLYAVPAVNATAQAACASQSGAFLLVSNGQPGTALVLQANNSASSGLKRSTSYVYCTDFFNTASNPATLPSFTVSWQQ